MTIFPRLDPAIHLQNAMFPFKAQDLQRADEAKTRRRLLAKRSDQSVAANRVAPEDNRSRKMRRQSNG